MISAVQLRKAIRRKFRLLFNRRHTHRVHCTLHRPQFLRLRQHAQKAKKRPTAFLRDAALAYLDRRYLVPANVEEKLERMIALFRNVATNLNQLAAHANTLKRVTVFDLYRARRLVLKLEEQVKSLVRNPEPEPIRDDTG